jgi:hypothetical protein
MFLGLTRKLRNIKQALMFLGHGAAFLDPMFQQTYVPWDMLLSYIPRF